MGNVKEPNVIENIDISTILSTVSDAKALVIFAHGAGADMEHEYIQTLTTMMNQQQLNVLRFNFPYMDKRKVDGKRRPPDRMPKLIECYQTILSNINTSLPVFIGGKSMGSRVAATIASDKALMARHNINGIICLGYPFHPVKKIDKLRVTPLQEAQLPIVILQGERDALGSKDEIASYDLPPNCLVHFFTDGDHDLKPRVKSGFTLKQHQTSAVIKMKRFIDECN